MELEYNSQRPNLSLPEYGRNIQKMVDFAKTVEDREERNKVVQAIIKIMGQLNPHLRDTDDYAHKLWDHIFIMAEFDLDVDSPYSIPTKETFETKPDKVSYPSGKIKYGHYGKTIQDLIAAIPAITDEKEKKALTEVTANLMKRFYLIWNRDSVEDSTILKQMNELSGGTLDLKEGDVELRSVQELGVTAKDRRNQRSGGRKGGRNQKKRRR